MNLVYQTVIYEAQYSVWYPQPPYLKRMWARFGFDWNRSELYNKLNTRLKL